MVTTEIARAMRRLLAALGAAVRDRILAERRQRGFTGFASIAARTAADTIYAVDRVGEDAIVGWFSGHWPRDWPVEVVMEGREDRDPLTFPAGTPVAATAWKCLLDPIDGTRNLMYDKRPAWVLAALAPQRGPATNLADVIVGSMTEVPVTKQTRCDQVAAIRGAGPAGIEACTIDLATDRREPWIARPSQATGFHHGFAGFVRFFPEGKALLAQLEEELWQRLHGPARSSSPLVFEDQYISTGGQIFELLAGHDRLIADLRPLALAKLGCDAALVCHPYDICTAFILEEAGGVIERPDGGPLRAPLDTVSPVAWVGFANPTLAALARPHLHALLRAHDLIA